MTRTSSPLAIIAAAFMTGLYLNALGWLGNAVLLQEEWSSVYEHMSRTLALPYSPLMRELVTLISDFVYAFALVWLYATGKPNHSAPRKFALELVPVLWLATVGMTYLVLVNSGFLPGSIAMKSGLWALVTFLPVAFFLPLALRPRNTSGGP